MSFLHLSINRDLVMKFSKYFQMNILQPVGLYKPTFRDCMKNTKLKLGAVGPDLACTPGERVFQTKDSDFITMATTKDGNLSINRDIVEWHDVPELYVDYIGKVKSILRKYIKKPEGKKNKVVKETVLTEYVHKSTIPSVTEQKPSKTKPFRIEIYKDREGRVIKKSSYTSDYKNKPNENIDYKEKDVPDYLLKTLGLW